MSAPTVDPALQLTIRAGLSLLFAWAAAHKVRDAARFRATVASYALLPGNWTGAAAALLIAGELSVAVALWIPPLMRSAAAAAAALLLLYAGAIAVNLLRGRRDVDCGCAGAARRQPISGWLVGRNLVLAAAALFATLPAAARTLTWIDAVTIAAGATAAALLYAAVDALLANGPRVALLALPRRAVPDA